MTREHARRIAETYDYVGEDGELLFQVVRYEPKGFSQRRPDPARPDRWISSLDGTRRVLYRLPRVLDAVAAGDTIYVAEGEKDVAALVRAGVCATCNPGGIGGGWKPDYSEVLAGADVIVIADRDERGRKTRTRSPWRSHARRRRSR